MPAANNTSAALITLIATTIRDNGLADAASLLTVAFKAFTSAQETALLALLNSGLLDGCDTRMVLEVAAGDLLEWVGDRMDALEVKGQTRGPAWNRHALRCDCFCAVVYHITAVERKAA